MIYLDTCVLVPLFIPEPATDSVRPWFSRHADADLAVSSWTLTEFASAMGIKVRAEQLQAEQATRACKLLQELAAESLHVLEPKQRDFVKAGEQLAHYELGLRAGDALHLAIAHNHDIDCLYTLDQRFLDAARALHVQAASPV
jgi:predicted nucleic acid-binding protein